MGNRPQCVIDVRSSPQGDAEGEDELGADRAGSQDMSRTDAE